MEYDILISDYNWKEIFDDAKVIPPKLDVKGTSSRFCTIFAPHVAKQEKIEVKLYFRMGKIYLNKSRASPPYFTKKLLLKMQYQLQIYNAKSTKI